MAVEDGSFAFLAQNSNDVICRVGADLTLLYVSPSVFRVLGWKPEEMTGQMPDNFILPKDASELSKSLSSGPDESFVTVRMRKKDGTLAWVEIRHCIVPDAATGKPAETIIVIRDITDRKTLEERLSVLELTDSRTGLSTQRAFDETLEREWNRSVRDGCDISLLLLDFDHFRHYHGMHREGDRCLGKAAAAVIGALRVTDFAALSGVEDIAIILPATGSGGAAKAAEKIQASVQVLRSSPQTIGAREGHMMVTIGMATVSARAGVTARMPELLRLGAESALRKAKSRRSSWPASPLALPGDHSSSSATDKL